MGQVRNRSPIVTPGAVKNYDLTSQDRIRAWADCRTLEMNQTKRFARYTPHQYFSTCCAGLLMWRGRCSGHESLAEYVQLVVRAHSLNLVKMKAAARYGAVYP